MSSALLKNSFKKFLKYLEKTFSENQVSYAEPLSLFKCARVYLSQTKPNSTIPLGKFVLL